VEYLIVKWLHVISSTVLFGTGIGSAFYLLATTLSRDVRAVAVVARMVVRADWLFTATTAVLQPLTGFSRRRQRSMARCCRRATARSSRGGSRSAFRPSCCSSSCSG
jgi:hypothetical protein